MDLSGCCASCSRAKRNRQDKRRHLLASKELVDLHSGGLVVDVEEDCCGEQSYCGATSAANQYQN